MSISNEKKTTIKGKVSDTKDGIYVGEVLIPEEIWPQEKNLRNLTGKYITIIGVVKTNTKPALHSKLSAPMVQKRVGSYKYMTKIYSVKID